LVVKVFDLFHRVVYGDWYALRLHDAPGSE